MNLEFSLYNENLIDDCANELKDAFKEEPWNEDWSFEAAKQRIYELSHSYGFIGFVLRDLDNNGKVVSFLAGRIMTYLDYKEYWIDDLSVSPSYKGNGLGSKIINNVKEYLQVNKRGVKRFSLYTVKGYSCFDFYLKKGFIYDSKMSYLYLDF